MITYNKICLMLPTFRRVERVKKFIHTAVETAKDRTRLRLSLCVNEKDEETLKYIQQGDIPIQHDVVLENTKQPNLAKYFNMLYEQTSFADSDTLVSMLGDDMYFDTPGWDEAILSAVNCEKGQAVVYCNDGFIAGRKLMVNLFTTRLVVDATKLPFMCPKFHAEMIDVVWTNVGLITQTSKYLEDIVIKHEHDMKNRAKSDETFKRLEPIRAISNTEENVKYAWQYATLAAANMIESGVGKWNAL